MHDDLMPLLLHLQPVHPQTVETSAWCKCVCKTPNLLCIFPSHQLTRRPHYGHEHSNDQKAFQETCSVIVNLASCAINFCNTTTMFRPKMQVSTSINVSGRPRIRSSDTSITLLSFCHKSQRWPPFEFVCKPHPKVCVKPLFHSRQTAASAVVVLSWCLLVGKACCSVNAGAV